MDILLRRIADTREKGDRLSDRGITQRRRAGERQIVLQAVVTPELLGD